MPVDNRKTKEELSEQIKEAVEEPQNEVPQEAKEVVEEVVIEEATEAPVVEVEEPKEEVKPVETPKETKPLTDYEREYKKSTQEAMTQYFKNRKITETFEEAEKLPEPSEQELKDYARTKGAEYDDLDDFSKGILRDTFINSRRFEKIGEVVKESRQLDMWADKVESFVNSPEAISKYPLVAENEEDFRKFCMKVERRGMNFDDLTASFLYGLSVKPVVKAPKGSVLTPSTGGGRDEKPTGVDDEGAVRLRTGNQKEYRRLIKEGKIKIEI